MNIRQMQVFHAIMRHGSISEAARVLDVAQPSVSTVLKHAEQTLGVKLFARIGGRLQPTPEAERLFPEIEQIYDQLGEIAAFAQDLRIGGAGRLALVANPTLASTFLAAAIARFRVLYPNVRIRLQTSISASQMADRVARREFDLGFGYGPNNELHTGIETIGRSRIGIAVPLAHTLARHPSIAPTALADQPMISFGAGSPIRTLAERVFGDAGLTFRPVIEASFSAAACALAQQGAGLAVVDMLVLRTPVYPDLAILPLETQRSIEYLLIHPQTRPHSTPSLTFCDLMREVTAEYEAASL